MKHKANSSWIQSSCRPGVLITSLYLAALCLHCAGDSTPDEDSQPIIYVQHTTEGEVYARNASTNISPPYGYETNCPIVVPVPGLELRRSIPCWRMRDFYVSADLSYVEFVRNAHAFAYYRGNLYLENIEPFPYKRVAPISPRQLELTIPENSLVPRYKLLIEIPYQSAIQMHICLTESPENQCASDDWTSHADQVLLDFRYAVPIVHLWGSYRW